MTPQFEGIAKKLVRRHLEVSLPARLGHFIDKGRGGESPDLMPLKNGTRTVIVVGAGASSTVFGRGQHLAEEILRLEPDRQGLEAALRRAAFARELSDASVDFESALGAVGRTPEGERRIREHISSRYAQTSPILLRYELIAHLLKHRFIDAVINFNFDELLDRSIADELGESSYQQIVSAQDTRFADFDPDSSRYLPCYFKPHGTASAPSTLRFTRDSYFDMPPQVSDAIQQVIGVSECTVLSLGYRLDAPDFAQLLAAPSHLNIFDLGLEALDPLGERKLWDWSSRAGKSEAPRSSEYTHVSITDLIPADKKPITKDGKPDPSEQQRLVVESIVKLFGSYLPRVDTRVFDQHYSVDAWWGAANAGTKSIVRNEDEVFDSSDSLLLAIWQELVGLQPPSLVDRPRSGDNVPEKSSESGGSTPRGAHEISSRFELLDLRDVQRHVLVAALFGYSPGEADSGRALGILHDRTVLEISLAVVRARGLTTLASLSSDRPYVRYEEYRRAGGGKSFIQMLRSIGIRRATMSADVFVLEPNLVELESAGEGRPEALTMYLAGLSQAKVHAELLARYTFDAMETIGHGKAVDRGWVEPFGIDLRRVFKEVSNQIDAEISAGSDAMCRATFAEPVPLPTHTAVKAAFLTVFAKAEAAIVRPGDLSFSEDRLFKTRPKEVELDVALFSGRKLKNFYAANLTRMVGSANGAVRLRLLLSSYEAVDRWISHFQESGLNPEYFSVRFVPWYAQNRYTLILKKNGRASRAVHYGKRNLVSSITPIYLWHQSDVRQIQRAFEIRWQEATLLEETMKTVRCAGPAA